MVKIHAVRLGAEQSVQRRRFLGNGFQHSGVQGIGKSRLAGADGLLHPGGGFAGRRRQPDPRRGCGLFDEQRQDAGQSGGLASAGAAGDHAKATQHSQGRRYLLPVRPGLGGKQAQQTLCQALLIHRP